MNITIIGSGYVGLVTGACLAELGNSVFCLDIDQERIDLLNSGKSPIYEPGLAEMIAKNLAAGRICFSTDIEKSVKHGDLQFISVGTPTGEDGSADLQYVMEAARNIGKYMTNFKVVIDKSTVPVGTADKVKEILDNEIRRRNLTIDFSVISNPEFLKEGAAIEDFMHPDRIVVGVFQDKSGEKAKRSISKLYANFNRHHERTIYMDVRSAELTKYAANAMLATRISFMNELANLAEVLKADIESVRQGIGSDSRIGHSFLYAGTGYGGSCFPKDIQALISTANQNNFELKILTAVQKVNAIQKTVLVRKIQKKYGDNLTGRTFALWGLAFKPNTDDMRAAPSRNIIEDLVRLGASIKAFDPVAIKEARNSLRLDLSSDTDLADKVVFLEDMFAVTQGADALIIATEWLLFRSPNFDELKKNLKEPVIFDGRNLFEPSEMSELGFSYHGIGRRKS